MNVYRAQVGDVIRSDAFASGRRDQRTGVVRIGGNWAVQTKQDGEYKIDPSYDGRDALRASAEFVVEKACSDGGGTGHGPHDVFPNGWHVTARRLFADGTYNARGEVITFYQSGCFEGMVKEVEFVRSMRLTFTAIPAEEDVRAQEIAKDAEYRRILDEVFLSLLAQIRDKHNDNASMSEIVNARMLAGEIAQKQVYGDATDA